MRGDRLRSLREAQNLTQKDLAERLHISESQIFRYEKDDIEPRADVVVKVAEYFNVTADYLLGLSEEQGVYVKSELKPQEQAAIAAWRRGERIEAIKVIVDDE
jgi:transcriptional regulator with XRE-family HTH domain